MSQQRVLPKIFNEKGGAHEEKGENARLSSFIGAIAIADLVKTTLGPKGMDKILQSMGGQKGNKAVTFTNDGATILKSIPIDNPAAKILVDTSKTQDSEVGDGTTSVAVLTGEFLREAEKLINQKIHPAIIMRGWRKAVKVAREAVLKSSRDTSKDSAAFRKELVNIARTTLSSKILCSHLDYFSNLAVDAVLKMKGATDLQNIHIVKILGGKLQETYLEEGFILNKRIGTGQPKRIENARILLANTSLDNDKIKIHGARVRVESVADVAKIEEAEKKKMKAKVEKILSHNINCFISRQLIYKLPESIFRERNAISIEHADFEGVERLAQVLGAEIVSTFDHPERVQLGECKLIEEVVIGEKKVVRFSGAKKGEACTIVIRGASRQVLDEAERSMHDALCILVNTTKNTGTVCGGGSCEMLMAKAVDDLAQATAGKEAVAIDSFARALRQLPTIIADNAGYDSSELVSQLRAAHHTGKHYMGLDMDKGEVADMREKRITESLRSKQQMLISAHEAAECILRVDEIIRCAPRQRQGGHGH
mmetsp:Transcript_6508/g.10115  ORF Transcript_6508/g.10115 Transcript_6508/m.10115 type:complete len:539 (-) Transcript_6508:129-1745(-)|eukprot:CAMPEP_0175093220 /NCGR_PEP_ID=MMETSP0086_2-20121207/2888_1 /TAXON_ID=136419 /ORGANISM="Unknown Unknown, Strain D1" /LENGTH=538 /DNA_ID=CAMNT_0016366151 /DNA_START=22 /DNA_END=1638 /DNA_ORIENTATION=-